jgi:hypothetical protein
MRGVSGLTGAREGKEAHFDEEEMGKWEELAKAWGGSRVALWVSSSTGNIAECSADWIRAS